MYDTIFYTIFSCVLLSIAVCCSVCSSGNFSEEIDPVDKENIWKSCCDLNPSVKYSEFVKDRVGLRPSRQPIR